MFLDRLLNQGSMPVLEQMLQFTDARQSLLAENVANVSTPGYVQKDLSLDQFQEILQKKVEEQESAAPGGVSFDDVSMDIQQPQRSILFHDGNNRSMEQLMSDQAKNALMHNMAVELLRDQYSMIETALREGK
ncbi:MAG: flagellar basal body rod protein FlgB [Tepidisphaeraceae bacterium]|jgi:flagellar basal-body rod protein FlgB